MMSKPRRTQACQTLGKAHKDIKNFRIKSNYQRQDQVHTPKNAYSSLNTLLKFQGYVFMKFQVSYRSSRSKSVRQQAWINNTKHVFFLLLIGKNEEYTREDATKHDTKKISSRAEMVLWKCNKHPKNGHKNT